MRRAEGSHTRFRGDLEESITEAEGELAERDESGGDFVENCRFTEAGQFSGELGGELTDRDESGRRRCSEVEGLCCLPSWQEELATQLLMDGRAGDNGLM